MLDKAASLPPGGWFVWPEPPTAWRPFAKKHLAPLRAEAYAAYDGRVIVRSTAEGTAKLAQADHARPEAAAMDVAIAAAAKPGAPCPNGRHERMLLKAMSKLGVAATKSNIAGAMGLQSCPADAMDALVRDGFAASRTNKSGRDEFFLTERGTSAAFEVLRQERT